MKFSDPRHLSLRYKVPLRVTALVLGTALVVTASLVAREYDELKRDLAANSSSLARVLAATLVAPLVHDDVWRAYEVISSPYSDAARMRPEMAPEVILVVDPGGRVYVSTQPERYPMLSSPAAADREYLTVANRMQSLDRAVPTVLDEAELSRYYTLAAVNADGVTLGTLVMAYRKSAFTPRFLDLLRRAGLTTLLTLALLLPVSWWWGQRTAVPLVRLARAMEQVGPELPEAPDPAAYPWRDEIGQLGTAFKRMLEELRDKAALERQVVVADRLAALGRLSAGIAHEINNPLGGMLNAISTWRRHGVGDPQSAKTLSLLERGLQQVKNTVAALLVEARVESHPLSPQDIEDTRTLVAADTDGVSIAWDNRLSEPLALPSTLVRQILINLLLNAIHAAAPHGTVRCLTHPVGTALLIEVENDGRHIPEDRLPYLFEPYAGHGAGGAGGEGRQGLGLWVTYQIVQQLGGEIVAESAPGRTRFAVVLPVAETS